MLPGAFAHPVPQLGLAGRTSGPSGLGTQLGQVGDGLVVLGRAHRLHPAGQHAGAFRPLEHHRGRPRVGGQPQSPGGEAHAVRTTLVCRSRLPNELCQAWRSTARRRRWSRARVSLSLGLVSSARMSWARSRTSNGAAGARRTRQATARAVRSPRRRIARAMWSVVARRPRAGRGPPARRRGRRRAQEARARAAQLDLGGQLDGVGPHPPGRASERSNLCRARRAAAAARARVERASVARQAQLGLRLSLPEPRRPYVRAERTSGVDASSVRPAASSPSARSCSAIARHHGALGRKCRVGAVHLVQRPDQVAREQQRVAEVVLRLGRLDPVARCRETVDGSRRSRRRRAGCRVGGTRCRGSGRRACRPAGRRGRDGRAKEARAASSRPRACAAAPADSGRCRGSGGRARVAQRRSAQRERALRVTELADARRPGSARSGPAGRRRASRSIARCNSLRPARTAAVERHDSAPVELLGRRHPGHHRLIVVSVLHCVPGAVDRAGRVVVGTPAAS